MITREQANLIADLARTVRPAWDTRAVVAMLLGPLAERDLAAIIWATIRTAADPEKRTPSAIAFDGDHWRAAEPPGITQAELDRIRTERQLRLAAAAHCDLCGPDGRLPSGAMCRHDPDADARALELAGVARAEIRPMLTNTRSAPEE